MDTLYFFILVLTVLVLAYKRVRLLPAMTIMIALTVLWTELRHLFYVPSWFRYGNGIVAVTLIGFAVGPLRRLLISDRLFVLFRKILPRISTTEQEALDAGLSVVRKNFERSAKKGRFTEEQVAQFMQRIRCVRRNGLVDTGGLTAVQLDAVFANYPVNDSGLDEPALVEYRGCD